MPLIRRLQADTPAQLGQITSHSAVVQSNSPPSAERRPPTHPAHTPSLLGRRVPSGGGAVRGPRRGLAGLAVGTGGRCRLFCLLIGSGMNKGRCLGKALQAGIGSRRKREWSCEVSSGWCKTPGAAANRLQMLLGRGGESSGVFVSDPESRALERPGEGWRPPGPRPPRPPAGSWSCCCSGSRRLPRHWPDTSRWELGERRSAVSFACRGSAACERTGGPRGPAGLGERRGERGVGVVLRCGGSGGASPARPCLAQCLALEVELPPPPQRPNERHRGCGAQGAAGCLGRPSPHPARGTATSSGDLARLRRPARPRTVSLCALRPRRRSSALDLGAARLPPGAAPRTPQLSGCGWQHAPRIRRWGFPPGSSRCSLCWQPRFGSGDAGFPAWPLESAEVLERAPLWLHRENAPAPSSGCAFCFLCAFLSKDPPLWHRAFGRNC